MKIAINGFGRIGRAVLRIALENNVNVVAINDLASPEQLAYLFKYDSVYGKQEIEAGKDFLKIGKKKILVLSEKQPEKLPWKKLNVDVVVEATGLFTDRQDAEKHLKAGAKKVVISAPAKNPDITVVPGVNNKQLKKSHKIISLASCTTNCLAPVAKLLNDKFGIKKAFMTTVHAYTSSQNIQDGPHKKMRRGRAGAENIVPTTSGATTAVEAVLPALKGKLDGLAMRVPVICGSIVDFVAELDKKTSKEEVNKKLAEASKKELKGILEYTEDEIVSRDVIGNPHSSIVDGLSTQCLGGNLVKVLAWYDNEYGYSSRLVDVLKRL
ncbi:MAG: type I glyceraldehyde-3-phosphate dehydrogenase [Candidatus Nanoarchaeia archaeon]